MKNKATRTSLFTTLFHLLPQFSQSLCYCRLSPATPPYLPLSGDATAVSDYKLSSLDESVITNLTKTQESNFFINFYYNHRLNYTPFQIGIS